MKKIIFNRRIIIGGYDKDLKLQTELKPTPGYYFEHEEYQFVVHKMYPSDYCTGWRVSELTTGCALGAVYLTRKETMQSLPLVFAQHHDEIDVVIANQIKKYGKAN